MTEDHVNKTGLGGWLGRERRVGAKNEGRRCMTNRRKTQKGGKGGSPKTVKKGARALWLGVGESFLWSYSSRQGKVVPHRKS